MNQKLSKFKISLIDPLRYNQINITSIMNYKVYAQWLMIGFTILIG